MSLFTPWEAITAELQRKAIEAMRRDSSLVHQCMTVADMERMSPEDRYTFLAYHALATLAASEKARIAAAESRPSVTLLADAVSAELNGAPSIMTPRVDWRVHYSRSGNRLFIADTFSNRDDAQRAQDRLSAEDGVSDVVVMKQVTFEFPA